MGGWDWLWIPAMALYVVGYVLLLSRAANRGSLRGPVKLALTNISVIILLLPFCHTPYSYGIAVLAVINVVITYRLYLAPVLVPGKHAADSIES